jgi:general secretion pathway protein D
MLTVCAVALIQPAAGRAQEGQSVEIRDDSIRVRFANTDLRAAIQALGRLLSKPVLTGTIGDVRVEFFETPVPVSRAALPGILEGLVEANGFEFSEDSTFYRVSARAPEAPPRGRGPQASAAAPSPDTAPAMKLFAVRLKHARAADVAATLNQLYGTGGTFSQRPGLSSGTLSDALRSSRAAPPAEGGGAAAAPAEGSASLIGVVTVVPDDLTNSLLIRASQADFVVLREGIAQLDIRPLQVLIEVVAVEARKDRQFSLGFNLQVPPQDVGDGTVEGTLTSAGLGDLVVKVMNLGKAQINATLDAARSRGDAEIISRPVLLASNNTEARLLVGTQQPFVQVSRSLPTETSQRDQVVQYRDVGTKLTVLPTINEDGYVSLLIQQEISQATGETQFSAPVISSRETVTQVLVADGQTIVIGGLRDRVHDQIRTGIPVLSDIPLLGGLFGGTKTRTTETELFLFITPTILASDADADAATLERLPEYLRSESSDSTSDADTIPSRPDTVPLPQPSGRRQ